MFGFLQWILVYTLLESVILTVLISISKRKTNFRKKISKGGYLVFIVGLLAYKVPQEAKTVAHIAHQVFILPSDTYGKNVFNPDINEGFKHNKAYSREHRTSTYPII